MGHQEVFDGDTSSEVYLYPMFVASSFHTFTKSLVIRYKHIGLLVVCLVVVIASVFLLLGRFLHFHFHSIDCPCGVLATLLELLNRCSSCLFNMSGLEQTVFALWCSVPTTLYFEERGGDCPILDTCLCG